MRFAILFIVGLLGLTAGEAGRTTLPAPDVAFVQQAIAYNRGEVKAAEVALERPLLSDVRAYAQELIREHRAAAEHLRGIAEDRHVAIPSTVSDDEVTDELRALLQTPGAEFTKRFLTERIASHEEAIRHLKAFIGVAADEDLKSFAIKGVKAIEKDLTTARRLASQY